MAAVRAATGTPGGRILAQLVVLLLLLGMTATAGATLVTRGKTAPIIVVGGGAAGLSTAYHLRRAGFTQVTVLEARGQYGGRVRTSNRFGYPTEEGAHWIHGYSPRNPLYSLARQTRARLSNSRDAIEVYDSGRKVNDITPYAESFGLLFEAVAAMEPAESLSLWDAIQQVIEGAGVEPSARDRRIMLALLDTVQNDFANSLTKLSARYYNEADEFPGGDRFVTSGYINILKPLVTGLRIQYNKRVSRVEIRSGRNRGVAVTVTDTRTRRTSVMQAAAVVVTVPLGVLKKNIIRFVPPLPPAINTAVRRLGFNVFNRLVMQFPKSPRNSTSEFLLLGTDKIEDMNGLVDINFHARGRNALFCLYNGDYGRETEEVSDARLVADTLRRLRTAVPAFRSLPQPRRYYRTKWAADPYTFGSYSSLVVGSKPSDLDAFTRPVRNVLFFAGEHTHRQHQATVHGAYLSGQRAARQVQAALT